MAETSVVPEQFKYCTVCHGAAFQGNHSTDAPNLSILSAWYIERQLLNYKNDFRGKLDNDILGREMQPMVSLLDEKAIAEISAFVGAASAMPAKSPSTGPKHTANMNKGEKLYQSCGACHGADGLGNKALGAPRLAGQQDWYLARQLTNYRNGSRGAMQGDQPGALMRASVSMLKDDEAIRDVVAFINTLNPLNVRRSSK